MRTETWIRNAKRAFVVTSIPIAALSAAGDAMAQEEEFEYAAKIACGTQKDPADLRLARGLYATTINIHNPSERPARLTKKLALTYPPGSQRRGEIKRIGTDEFGPDEALETDCNDILRRVFGGTFPTPYFEGFVIIQSRTSLDVTAVYSTASLERTQGGLAHSSIDVEQIRERRRRADGNLPDLIPVPDPARGFCVRDGDKLRVTVRNQGSAPAGPSTTTLDFGAFGTQSQPTPALAAGASAVVIFTIPTNPNCFDPNCEFRITVDSAGVVTESDEGNNVASGVCLG
jgi:hypothetical protein